MLFKQIFVSIAALLFSLVSQDVDLGFPWREGEPRGGSESMSVGVMPAALPPRLPDLVVVKDDNVAPHETVYPGSRITYTILYTNTGVGIAHHVVLTETLPGHTRYVGFGWTHAGGDQYVTRVGTLAYGQGGTLQFVVEVEDASAAGFTRVINHIAIGGDERDANVSDNSFREATFLPSDARLYVACRDSNSIDVFNLQDLAYVTSFDAGPSPFGMLVDEDRLYVVNTEDPAAPHGAPDTVSIVDLETHQIVRTVTVGSGPLHLAALDGYIYVSNHDFEGEGVTVIDAATGSVSARLTLDRPLIYDWGFFGITSDPVRQRIYATKRFMGGEGVWRITPTGAPSSFALDWMVNARAGLPNSKPYTIMYHGVTDQVYVTFPYLDQVRAYDPDSFTPLDTYQTQRQVSNLADTNGGKGLVGMGSCVYNANYAARSVTVLAAGDCCAPLALQRHSAFKLYLPLLGRRWEREAAVELGPRLETFGQSERLLRPAQATVTHIPVPGHPKGLAAEDGYVYVTLPDENRVAVIDVCAQRVVYEIPTPGRYPQQAVVRTEN